MSSRFADPNLPLPTRDDEAHTATQGCVLGATYNNAVTSQATAQDLRIELPSASEYPGLDFTITHRGEFVTEVVDENGAVLYTTQVPGTVIAVESDGTTWMVTSPVNVAPVARVWDMDTLQFRQATTVQDAIDTIHALVASLVQTLTDEGIDVPTELEEFHGTFER